MAKRWKHIVPPSLGVRLREKPHNKWTQIDKFNDCWVEWYTLPIFDKNSGNEIRVMKHPTHEQPPWKWTITHTSSVHKTIISLTTKVGKPYRKDQFKTADDAKEDALRFLRDLSNGY